MRMGIRFPTSLSYVIVVPHGLNSMLSFYVLIFIPVVPGMCCVVIRACFFRSIYDSGVRMWMEIWEKVDVDHACHLVTPPPPPFGLPLPLTIRVCLGR